MKLILTEEQVRFIINEERMAQFLNESFLKSNSMKELKAKIKQALLAGVAVSVIATAVNGLSLSDAQKSEIKDFIETVSLKHKHISISDEPLFPSKEDYLNFQKRVDDCRAYMEYALNNQNFTLKSTGLKPETLVAAADEYNIPLPFIMASAHLESCFGATNRAKRTNSVFSVGSYDDGTDAVTYKDPNDSVHGWARLLWNHYMNDGKTVFHLMTPGMYVNDQGKRYASNENYESNLRSIYDRIIRMYPSLK